MGARRKSAEAGIVHGKREMTSVFGIRRTESGLKPVACADDTTEIGVIRL